MSRATDIPNHRAEEQPSREEPGSAVPAEGKGGQGQENPDTGWEKTFLEPAEDAMNAPETLDRLIVYRAGKSNQPASALFAPKSRRV